MSTLDKWLDLTTDEQDNVYNSLMQAARERGDPDITPRSPSPLSSPYYRPATQEELLAMAPPPPPSPLAAAATATATAAPPPPRRSLRRCQPRQRPARRRAAAPSTRPTVPKPIKPSKKGPHDPDNVTIVKLRQQQNLSFQLIAAQLNTACIAAGKSAKFDYDEVHHRYYNNAKAVCILHGLVFAPCEEDREEGRVMKFKDP